MKGEWWLSPDGVQYMIVGIDNSRVLLGDMWLVYADLPGMGWSIVP